ncbi:MAG: PilZ domain-containing protein [Candidatus Omnitrophica bacterium]|nr:PilZ domain-containing protein [Candidatus Omnitrophota bacterium]
MGLILQLTILAVLVLILLTLFIDEKRLKAAFSPNSMMTGYWNGTERRTSIRIDTVLNAKYCIDKSYPKKERLDIVSRNISHGGILISLREKLPTSTILTLDIELPDNQRCASIRGEVVWVKETSQPDDEGRKLFDTGIKFVTFRPEEKEKLDRHIKSLV